MLQSVQDDWNRPVHFFSYSTKASRGCKDAHPAQWQMKKDNLQKEFRHKNHRAADDCHRQQACAHPGGGNADDESQSSCYRRLGGVDDGREGHDGQGHVGYIVEKLSLIHISGSLRWVR